MEHYITVVVCYKNLHRKFPIGFDVAIVLETLKKALGQPIWSVQLKYSPDNSNMFRV